MALERLASRLGGMDVLVLSSGTGDLNPNLDYAVERRTLDTNVTGWTCVADWAIRRFETGDRGIWRLSPRWAACEAAGRHRPIMPRNLSR
mgnify:CR=1 FL=1